MESRSTLEPQDVEMLVEVSGESGSVKRGADAVTDNEERARVRLKLKASEAKDTTFTMS